MTQVIKLDKEHDNVNNPKHYLSPAPLPKVYVDDEGNYYVQAIDVIKAWCLQKSAYLFNVVKYILRSGKKDDYKQDLKKARYYLDEEIGEID